MSEHKITLTWKRGDTPFEYQKYSRDHTWKFDGGHEMQASANPTYLGNPKLVDPEEAFVASLSSCHMKTMWDLVIEAMCQSNRASVNSGFCDIPKQKRLWLRCGIT